MKFFTSSRASVIALDVRAGSTYVMTFILAGTAILAVITKLHQPISQSPAFDPPRSSSVETTTKPARLVIPSIKVNAPVEDVGLLSDGSMDAPKGWNDVGWYDLGPRPGETGNAVMAGHLDSYIGAAVFWHLDELKPGDTVSVIDTAGNTHQFRVTSMHSYMTDNPPMQKIFGTATGSHLNLITCDGTWNGALQRYDHRLVVYTDAVR
ncbi:MAG TPA: class F sortase [Candidatus Peribacteraceae bacterium]|nr:class F sortase [Candidatus Peribacteraceae bacterium]